MKKTTKIMKLGINGEGIAYPNKRITFIPQALPKEVVDYEIIKRDNGYDTAKLLRVVEPSKDRIEPICPISDLCGGCQLMHLKYKKQLTYKQKLVTNSIKKYTDLDPVINLIEPSKPSLNYRYHVKLPLKVVDGQVVVGMFEPDSNRFVPLNNCHIHTPEVNELIEICQNILNDYQTDIINKKIKGITIRCHGKQAQVCIVTTESKLNPELVKALLMEDRITSLYQNMHPSQKINTFLSRKFVLLGGLETIDITLGNHTFGITPAGFFQLNLKQAEKIHKYLKNKIDREYDVLLDLFAGVGVFGFSLQDKADKIIALEINQAAVTSANLYAAQIKLDKYEAKCMDANIALSAFSKKKQSTLAIIDPPRTGIPHNLLESLVKSPVTTLVYVSCNPSTFAKNMDVLSQKYDIVDLQPFDMFSQTAQVEIVAILERKNA